MVDRGKPVRSVLVGVSCLGLGVLAGCGSGSSSTFVDPSTGDSVGTTGGSTSTGTGPSSGTGSLGLSYEAGVGTTGTTAGAGVWPPPGFINVTNTTTGAYALGPQLKAGTDAGAAVSGADGGSTGPCGALLALARDFKMGNQPGGHPDFETRNGDDKGIVADTLGADDKPVYANPGGMTPTTSGQANFDQWYHDTPGVNLTYVLGLHLVQNAGIVTFQADEFYPLDGQGFGNQGARHNYSFTTEIHTAFTYNGGETFTFIGDDDVFVFINKKRVINLGGIHVAETGQVKVDAMAATLGLQKGKIYDLAVFHAERHTSESHFRIDTTLAFVDCGQIPSNIQ